MVGALSGIVPVHEPTDEHANRHPWNRNPPAKIGYQKFADHPDNEHACKECQSAGDEICVPAHGGIL